MPAKLNDGNLEKYVLGGILEDPGLLGELQLTETLFSEQRNKKVFRHIARLEADGEEITTFNLLLHLEEQALELRIKEVAELGAIPSRTRKAAEKLREMATRRQLISAAREIVARAKEDEAVAEVCGFAEESVLEATGENMTSSDWYEMYEVIEEYDSYQRQIADMEGVIGVPTGYDMLDDFSSGMMPGDLIYLGGRPGMGKTTLALNISLNAAQEGHKVLFFSLEMTRRRVMQKILAHLGGIPTKTLRNGIDFEDQSLVDKYSQAISQANIRPLLLNDDPGATLAELCSVARRAKRSHDIDLIVIDYLQLIRYTGGYANMSDAKRLGEVSDGLRRVAKKLDIPVLCLAQLNRKVSSRDNKRPFLTDLRESGELEEDATCVWFLYRHGYYYPETAEQKGIATLSELIIAKNRLGPTGMVLLDFIGGTSTFKEATHAFGKYKRALGNS